jgi:hypothetical protein
MMHPTPTPKSGAVLARNKLEQEERRFGLGGGIQFEVLGAIS